MATRNKYVTELFKEINEDPSLLMSTYKKNGNGGPLAILFKHAFTAEGKFLLPDGTPPYKPTPNPQGMTAAIFQQEISKFYVFCRSDLTPAKRETMFVQLAEAIHPTEAAILFAIKDQTLTSLYPNITRKLAADAGFIPPATEAELKVEVAAVKKSVKPKGRPPKSASLQSAT